MTFRDKYSVIESPLGWQIKNGDGREIAFYPRAAGWTRKMIETFVETCDKLMNARPTRQ